MIRHFKMSISSEPIVQERLNIALHKPIIIRHRSVFASLLDDPIDTLINVLIGISIKVKGRNEHDVRCFFNEMIKNDLIENYLTLPGGLLEETRQSEKLQDLDTYIANQFAISVESTCC